MKVLVTGGYGFIGSNFIRFLENIDFQGEIINIDKLGIGSNLNNLKDLKLNYKFIKNDISKVPIDVSDFDYIINFASETHVDRSIADPSQFYYNNLNLIFNILETLRKGNNEVKMVHISTDEVYGDIHSGSFTEESQLKPSNPYSATKAAQDLLVLAYARTYGLNVSITRTVNNYGPYQFPEKLIPKTIIRALKNLSIPIYGSGEQIRNWIHAMDNSEAIYTVMMNGKKGEIYNIPGSAELKNINIARKILKILKKSESLIRFVEDRPGHDIRYSLSGAKIKELGWTPKIEFEKGIEETVRWYLNNEWWWRPLVNDEVLKEMPWK